MPSIARGLFFAAGLLFSLFAIYSVFKWIDTPGVDRVVYCLWGLLCVAAIVGCAIGAVLCEIRDSLLRRERLDRTIIMPTPVVSSPPPVRTLR